STRRQRRRPVPWPCPPPRRPRLWLRPWPALPSIGSIRSSCSSCWLPRSMLVLRCPSLAIWKRRRLPIRSFRSVQIDVDALFLVALLGPRVLLVRTLVGVGERRGRHAP